MSCDKGKYKNKTLCESFKNAFNGICEALKSERNLIIHVTCTAVVIAAGFIFGIDFIRWICLTLVIGIVFVSEMLNTAIEKLTICYHRIL